MAREPEYVGRKLAIECVELPKESCPAGDFLDSLDEGERTKFDVLFEYLGDHYPQFSNREKFKKLEGSDGIFEFKSGQHRIFCFFTPDQRIMLAFGVIKKDDRHKPKDIKRAERIKDWFFSKMEGTE